MTSIEELRRRVQAAQSTVGQLGSEGREYGDRLSELVDGLNHRLRRQEEELTVLRAERDRLAHEAGDLKDMLNTLLGAVEHRGGEPGDGTMRTLYDRLSDLSDAPDDGAGAVSGARLPGLGMAADARLAETPAAAITPAAPEPLVLEDPLAGIVARPAEVADRDDATDTPAAVDLSEATAESTDPAAEATDATVETTDPATETTDAMGDATSDAPDDSTGTAAMTGTVDAVASLDVGIDPADLVSEPPTGAPVTDAPLAGEASPWPSVGDDDRSAGAGANVGRPDLEALAADVAAAVAGQLPGGSDGLTPLGGGAGRREEENLTAMPGTPPRNPAARPLTAMPDPRAPSVRPLSEDSVRPPLQPQVPPLSAAIGDGPDGGTHDDDADEETEAADQGIAGSRVSAPGIEVRVAGSEEGGRSRPFERIIQKMSVAAQANQKKPGDP